MTHHHARLVAVAIAAVSFSTPITAQQEPTPPTTLKTVVETLGGSLSGTVTADGGPWASANLGGTEATDADLAHFMGLTALETLLLDGTQITDAGLAHLKELTTLTHLWLSFTGITDAGLVHLTGLTALETLGLDETQITDASLAHLTGLTGLESLDLRETQVTDAGIASLRESLPNVVISTGALDFTVPPPPPPPQ